MGDPQDAAAGPPAAAAAAAEDACLNWWQRVQLPLLAAVESCGVVLVLGGADGSAELRLSVLLPLLLLQHGWTAQPQRLQRQRQRQHILVALESAAAAASAATAGRAWGGARFAAAISSSSSGREAAYSQLLYLTNQQLLQRLLQQPLLPGCSVAAVEVSLQHGFCTELLLPLLQKVRKERPHLRLLLLLPPAAVEPQWALHLARYFAADAPGKLDEAVTPRGALEVLEAAALQRQQRLLRLLAPSRGRWDLKTHQQCLQHQQQQQQQLKRQRSPSGSEADEGGKGAAAPAEAAAAAGVPIEVEVLSSSSSSIRCNSSRKDSEESDSVSCISSDEVVVVGARAGMTPPAAGGAGAPKKKKDRRKQKKKIARRLRKIHRKLEKLSSGSPSSLLKQHEEEESPASPPPRRFRGEQSHAVEPPAGSSSDEASAASARPAAAAAAARAPAGATPLERRQAAGDQERGTVAGLLPGEPKGLKSGGVQQEALAAVGGSLRKALESVCVVGAAPASNRVAVKYLKKPTPNFVRTAADVVASLVSSAAGSPQGLSSFNSIFVFLPSPEEVSALAQTLQQRLQQLLQRLLQWPQQLPLQGPPVEVVCLSPDCSPSLPPPSSSLRIFLSASALPPCISSSAMSVAVVVDCMYTRSNVYDSFLSVSRPCNLPVSKALADLRASLAGRARPGGCCYRLCTAAAFAAAAAAPDAAGTPKHELAMISPAALEDIAPLLLKLKALGVRTLQHLPLLQPPPHAALAAAAKKLLHLQAVDATGSITKPLGQLMATGFLSPELTRLLLISADQAFGCSVEAAALCALLSGPPVWRRSALQALGGPRGAPSSGGAQSAASSRQRLSLCRALLGAVEGDPLTALNVFSQFFAVELTDGEAAAAEWAERHLVEEATLRRAAKKQQMLLKCLDSCGLPRLSCKGDSLPLLRALTAAFCLSVARHSHGQTYRLLRLPAGASAPPFVIHPSSVLVNCQPPLVVFANAFWRDGCVYMQQVTAVEPSWLPEVGGHLYSLSGLTA